VGFPLTTLSQPAVPETIAEALAELIRFKAIWVSGTSATFGMQSCYGIQWALSAQQPDNPITETRAP